MQAHSAFVLSKYALLAKSGLAPVLSQDWSALADAAAATARAVQAVHTHYSPSRLRPDPALLH